MHASRRTPQIGFHRLTERGWFRGLARILVITLLAQGFPFDAVQPRAARAQSDPAILWVDDLGDCGGRSPCFPTMQSAINAARSGEIVRVLAGEYVEQLRIRLKNPSALASEDDRIVIEADPEAPVGSVVLRGARARCEGGYAVEFDRSKYVTLRGLTISGAGIRGVGLRGGSRENRGIHLERLRLFRGATSECSGGLDVGRGNPDTVIANSLIYGNGRNGIRFRDATGGSYLVYGNTIVRNGWNGIYITKSAKARIWNNVVAFNGTAKERLGGRHGLRRQRVQDPNPEDVELRGNLFCGNRLGEIDGPVLDGTSDAGNQTPTGSEGPGVVASARCAEVTALFVDANGANDVANDGDDDFRLAAGSPAIDVGFDPLRPAPPVLPAASPGPLPPGRLFEADYLGEMHRPRAGQGPEDESAEFDAGAIESPGEVIPTPTPTSIPTTSPPPEPTPTAPPTPTPTATPSPEPTPTAAPTATPTPEATPTPAPTATLGPTPTPEPIPCEACDACTTGRPGICSAGRTHCSGPFGQPECRTTIEPRSESCGNQVDEDCDGEADEGGVPRDLPTSPPITGVFVEPLGTPITFANGGSAVGLVQGDFDRDGNLDVAVTQDVNIAGVGGRRLLSILLGHGDGTFAAPANYALPDNGTPNAVLAHDFDRDGALDLLVAAFERRQVLFYRGNGDGTFREPVASDVVIRVTQTQVADLNCDGVLDVASIGEGTNATVALGNGDGTFGTATSYAFNHNIVDLALADLNGDSHPDLVVGSHEFAPTTGIGVRLNDGSGQFGALIHTPGQSVPDQFGNHGHNQVFGLQIADFDLDGKADAVASTQGPVGCFMFMKGNGDGSFALPDLYDNLPDRDPSWTCVGGGNLMRRYTDNVAPDVNADGKPDVLFTYGSDDNRVVVGLGRGDGTFATNVFAASAGTGFPGGTTHPRADGAGVAAAVVGDVNGDCMLDLVTTGFETNASRGRMGVLLARAPGDFHAPRLAQLLRDPTGDSGHQTERGVAAGDFNNDGKPDFVAGVGRAFFTVPGKGIGIDVFEGDGDGRGRALPFTLNNYDGEIGIAFLRAADLDRDGNLDVAFQSGYNAHRVTVVYGAGDFTFGDRQDASSPRLTPNTAIRNLITADLDGDGDEDVATILHANNGRKLISTFRNPGTRAPFEFVAEADVGALPPFFNGRGIVATDFDGDDVADLVADDTGSEPQRVLFFKGNGDLTYRPGVTIHEFFNQGAASAEDFAAADLDRDGDQDLVMAQYYHGCAYVLLGHGDGTFDTPVCYPAWSGRTSRVVIDDFDVDDKLDIVVGIDDAGLVFVRGRGDGTFDNGQPYAIGKHVMEAVNVADFNRDGRPDLLWSYNNGNSGHSIVLSNPSGAVPTPTPAPTATLPPGVTPSPSPTPTPTPTATPVRTPPAGLTSIVVEPVDPIILAGDSQAFTATGVFDDGTSQNLTAIVGWSSDTPATASISGTGVATGLVGGTSTITATLGPFSGSSTLTVGARAAGDGTPPSAEITSPAANDEIVQLVDVVGTAADASFLKYELEVAPAGETTFVLLRRGGAPVSGGVLGQLDPTLLLNGPYTVRLRVFDRGGNVSEASAVYLVSRERKVGQFSISFSDLNVPMSGIPITVTRTYDSRDKGLGDFGIGWRVDVQSLRVRTNRVLGTGWTTQNVGFNVQLVALDQHYVTLTLPDGKVETFDLQLSPTAQPFALDFTHVVGFAPRPGTLGRLEGLDNGSLLVVPGGSEVELWDDLTLQTYDPRRFRYTTKDGRKIVVDRVNGLESITDPNGNVLTFGSFSITHSAGASIAIVRDGLGRITQITDPAGAAQSYVYDGAGDLVSHTSRSGNTTTFAYDADHGLIRIVDPTGTPVSRNEYDDAGRLIATTDASGKRVELTHEIGTSRELVRDRLGHQTVMDYDAAGNVTRKVDALGGITTYTHDAQGNVLTESDPLGRTSIRTYDAQNNPLTVTDFDGNTAAFTYNDRSQPLTATDAEGRVTSYVYDASGNLTRETSPEGGVTIHTYDAAGNRLSTTTPAGTTVYSYDAAGRRLSETDPLGNVSTATYDANGNRESETRTRTLPNGSTETIVTRYGYSDDGRIVEKEDALGHRFASAYEPNGKIESLTDPRGRTTTYDYDANGNLVRTTFADGSTQESGFDAEGRETSRRDRDGRQTTFEYDALGRLVETVHPDGTTASTAYDAAGRIESKTDENGRTTTYAYAPNRQVVTDALGHSTTHDFDGSRRKTRMVDALGRETRYEYESHGYLTKTIFPDGTEVRYGYDTTGRRIAETDQEGRTTRYRYDPSGRLLEVEDALGGLTTYAYDEVGSLVGQTDANGHTTRFEYDALRRLVRRIRPSGAVESYGYDANANVIRRTDPAGASIVLSYDANDRLSEKTVAGGPPVLFTYTPEGLRTRAGGDLYEYDARGRLRKETKASGDELTYTYDAAGNRLSMTTPAGTIAYTHDALNRLASVTDDGGTTSYTYDLVGNLASTTYPNGVTTTYVYDDLDRLVEMTNTGPGGGILSSYVYTLSPSGLRLEVVESGSAIPSRTVTYAYDDLLRLVGETIDAPGTANDHAVEYDYDAVGNRTRVVRNGIVTTYAHDVDDRLASETTGGTTTTYSYDPNGNLIGRTIGSQTDTFTYDAEHRLRGAQVTGGSVYYDYDADGMRSSATVAGATTTFLTDKNRDLAQVVLEQTGAASVAYTYGTDLVRRRPSSGGASYYLYDGHLSTRQLADASGAVTDTYAYDAFGQLLSSSGSTPNRYLYSGEQFDPNVGFYYLRARYYDAKAGRFISPDPYNGRIHEPPSLHRYLYANANPVSLNDPTGKFVSVGGLAQAVVALAVISLMAYVVGQALSAVLTAVYYKAFDSRSYTHAITLDEKDFQSEALRMMRLLDRLIAAGKNFVYLAPQWDSIYHNGNDGYNQSLFYWRGKLLTGSDLNYYFEGQIFYAAFRPVEDLLLYIYVWKAYKYQALPNGSALWAGQQGYYNTEDMCREQVNQLFPRVCKRLLGLVTADTEAVDVHETDHVPGLIPAEKLPHFRIRPELPEHIPIS